MATKKCEACGALRGFWVLRSKYSDGPDYYVTGKHFDSHWCIGDFNPAQGRAKRFDDRNEALKLSMAHLPNNNIRVVWVNKKHATMEVEKPARKRCIRS